MEPLVNPKGTEAFGRRNIILSGAGDKRTPIIVFAGPLSVKGVLEGVVEWRTSERAFRVAPDAFVVLNDGQEYTLSPVIDATSRTFCAFFERGFVECAARACLENDDVLLDGNPPSAPFGFFEQLTPASSHSGRALSALARAVAARATAVELDWLFHDLAHSLARAAIDVRRAPNRLSSARASTRGEIYRRMLRGRAAVEDDLAFAWTLRAMATAAAMAPHHFARSFRQCFGETPRAFLARRRLERAQALLRQGKLTVTEVCFEVGYVSLPSFSASFRALHGIAPSRVRD